MKHNMGGSAKRQTQRRGAILGVVMVVVLLVSMIGLGLMNLGTSDGVEAVRAVQQAEAFWLAEAGVHDSIARLATDSWFREGVSRAEGSPTPFGPVSLAKGTFQGTMWRGLANTADSNTYYITSSGTMRGAARTIRQTTRVTPDGFSMPFYSNAITAQVLDVNNMVVVSNGVVSCFTTNATPASWLDTMTFKSPPDVPPPLDTSDYDNLINIAASSGTAASTVTSVVDRTVYVLGNTEINSLVGPGTLVVSGNATFKGLSGDPATMGPNINLIVGGTIEFSTKSSVGTNCLIYAGTSIEFNQGGTVINNSSMLTPGAIVAKQSFTFSGIVYAGTAIDIRQGADIRGVLVSGGLGDLTTDLSLKNGVTITYDPGALPSAPPPGLGRAYVARSDWQEL